MYRPAEELKSSPHSSGFSSELSPQSSSPSHFQPWGLQRVLLHWNSSFGQCLTTEPKGMGKKKKSKVLHASYTGSIFCSSLTTTVTFLLIAAVQTVSVSVTVPSQRDAVTVSALVLVTVTLHLTAVLCARRELLLASGATVSPLWEREERYLVRAVSTVVVTIALPAAGNAAAICAGKLALRTLPRH